MLENQIFLFALSHPPFFCWGGKSPSCFLLSDASPRKIPQFLHNMSVIFQLFQTMNLLLGSSSRDLVWTHKCYIKTPRSTQREVFLRCYQRLAKFKKNNALDFGSRTLSNLVAGVLFLILKPSQSNDLNNHHLILQQRRFGWTKVFNVFSPNGGGKMVIYHGRIRNKSPSNKHKIIMPAPSKGWCLNPKGLLSGTPTPIHLAPRKEGPGGSMESDHFGNKPFIFEHLDFHFHEKNTFRRCSNGTCKKKQDHGNLSALPPHPGNKALFKGAFNTIIPESRLINPVWRGGLALNQPKDLIDTYC